MGESLEANPLNSMFNGGVMPFLFRHSRHYMYCIESIDTIKD